MKVTKIFQWDAAHKLTLPYDSPCCNLHGHTYKVEVEVESEDLDSHGLVMDFSELKTVVQEVAFDHKYINDWMGSPSNFRNPTAENLVLFLKEKLDEIWQKGWPQISRIRIWETPTSWAEQSWPRRECPPIGYVTVQASEMHAKT